MTNDRPCTCPLILLPSATPCALHVGFRDDDGTWWNRCGDSDATGGPYYVSQPRMAIEVAQ